jgi:hypothetical protein
VADEPKLVTPPKIPARTVPLSAVCDNFCGLILSREKPGTNGAEVALYIDSEIVNYVVAGPTGPRVKIPLSCRGILRCKLDSAGAPTGELEVFYPALPTGA